MFLYFLLIYDTIVLDLRAICALRQPLVCVCVYRERVCVSNIIHTHAHTHAIISHVQRLFGCAICVFLPFYYSHMPFERAIKQRTKKKYQIQIICDKISHKTTHWHIRIHTHTYTHGNTSIGVRKNARERERGEKESERRLRRAIEQKLFLAYLGELQLYPYKTLEEDPRERKRG